MDLLQRYQSIRMILSDVDGVMTDGLVEYDNQGVETKRFHVRDGLGIKLWQLSGGLFGLVTQRSSQIVKIRAGELGISLVRQGVIDKLATVRQIADEHRIGMENIAYIGDDLPDLPVMRSVGLSVAVADAAGELLESADVVTHVAGGKGAVRDMIETILKNQGRWDALVQEYKG